MSMLAMAHPVPHSAFKRELAWDEGRQPDYAYSRSRPDPERIALPSIRQAFPELQLRVLQPENNSRTASSVTSPTAGFGGAMTTTPEYVHSPNTNKRRRLSIVDGKEERSSHVPRLYATSPTEIPVSARGGVSPNSLPSRPSTDSWTSPRPGPYAPQNAGNYASLRSPITMEVPEHLEPRPVLPGLPHFNFDREPVPPRIRGHSTKEGYPAMPRPLIMHTDANRIEAGGPVFRQSGYFGYHHPTRVQSLSMGSIHAMDCGPFSAGPYSPHYDDYVRYGDMGGMGMGMGMGMGGDNKQRKRRGNLPKETTDKLRAWFLAHLHHPYPTEDEKQELMRQTNLQMNQISNWFINARRRQLPNMINNARAESEAMSSARGVDGKILPSTEKLEYDDGKHGSIPLSDGEGSAFDDDLDTPKRLRPPHMKRESV